MTNALRLSYSHCLPLSDSLGYLVCLYLRAFATNTTDESTIGPVYGLKEVEWINRLYQEGFHNISHLKHPRMTCLQSVRIQSYEWLKGEWFYEVRMRGSLAYGG